MASQLAGWAVRRARGGRGARLLRPRFGAGPGAVPPGAGLRHHRAPRERVGGGALHGDLGPAARARRAVDRRGLLPALGRTALPARGADREPGRVGAGRGSGGRDRTLQALPLGVRPHAGGGRVGLVPGGAAVGRRPDRRRPDERRHPLRRPGLAHGQVRRRRDRGDPGPAAVVGLRATTACPSAASTNGPAPTSTRSTRCSSAPPSCGSPTRGAAGPSTPAAWLPSWCGSRSWADGRRARPADRRGTSRRSEGARMHALCRLSATELAALIASRRGVEPGGGRGASRAHRRGERPRQRGHRRAAGIGARRGRRGRRGTGPADGDRPGGGAARGPFHGVPFTVKENIDCLGSATTHGVPALEHSMPSQGRAGRRADEGRRGDRAGAHQPPGVRAAVEHRQPAAGVDPQSRGTPASRPAAPAAVTRAALATGHDALRSGQRSRRLAPQPRLLLRRRGAQTDDGSHTAGGVHPPAGLGDRRRN